MKNLIIKSLEKIQKSNRISQEIMINIDIFSASQLMENDDLSIEELKNKFNNALFFLSFDCSEDYLAISKNTDLNFEISNWMNKQNLI